MSRVVLISGLLAVVLAAPAVAQLKKRPDQQEQKGQTAPKEQTPTAPEEPPEEDASLLPKTNYSFNPIEASKNIKVATFYWKKGKYKAAALRYAEATRWDPGSAEAWLKLGDAREKMNDTAAARAAWEKFLEVAPDDKEAPAVRKKLASLSAAKQSR